jgi:tetratricopeptide (TPR) repeat protein
VEAAVALKAGSRSSLALFLPPALKDPVEPIVHITGISLAAAAERLAAVQLSAPVPTRELEARWLLRRSEELDPEGAEARLARVSALLALGASGEALVACDAAIESGPPPDAPRRLVRQHKAWLGLRERALRELGRSDEADRTVAAILEIPPRNPSLPARLIDLSRYYTAGIYDGRGWHGDPPEHLRFLPETFRARDGIDFDIRGLVQVNTGVFPDTGRPIERGKDLNQMYGKSYPDGVTGVPVGMETQALHFLVGAAHSSRARNGTEVARLVIRYEDGGTVTLPLRLGEDVVDWVRGENPGCAIDVSRVAWIGPRPLKVLYLKTWRNPEPRRKVASFDFVSAKALAAPFLVAATAE